MKRPEPNYLTSARTTKRLGLLMRSFFDFHLNRSLCFNIPNNSEGPLRFLLNGFSKMIGLPQMKLGWIVVMGPKALRNEAITRLSAITDTYLSVHAGVQQATPDLFNHRRFFQNSMNQRIKHNIDLVEKISVKSIRIKWLPPQGGWAICLSLPPELDDETAALALLNETGVLVHPGYYYGLNNAPFWVISLITAPDLFEEGMDIMLDFFS